MLLNDVDEHVPLSAIVQWSGEQPRNMPVIHGAIDQFDNPFKKVICSFQLIPEEGVVLAEFKVFQIHLLHCTDAEQIQSSEHPASPATLLVGHAPIVQHVTEGEITFGNYLSIDSDFVHGDLADGILGHSIDDIILEIATQCNNSMRGQCPVL